MCNLSWTHKEMVSPPVSLRPPRPPGEERERCMDIYISNEIYLQYSITGILILVCRRLLTDKYTVDRHDDIDVSSHNADMQVDLTRFNKIAT